MSNETLSQANYFPARLRWAVLFGILTVAALIAFGLLRFPQTLSELPTSYQSLVEIAAILGIYGAVAWFGLPSTDRLDTYVVRAGVVGGLIAGAIFILEMALEYVLLPSNNDPMQLIAYYVVFAVFLLVGLWVARQRNSVFKGVVAALWSAIINELVWIIGLFLIYYLFNGTRLQVQVLQADGRYLDFARSGISHFSSFMMGDLMKLGFYHSLLLPLIAIVFGIVGAGIGKLLARMRPAAI